MYVFTHMFVCVGMHVCTHRLANVDDMYICISIFVYVYICMYICMYVYTQAC